jgi:hypothetical protein
MKTTENKTIVSFKIGRGGHFNNAGHLFFIGEKNINNVISQIKECTFSDYKNRREILKKYDYSENNIEKICELIADKNFSELERIFKITERDLGDEYYTDGNGNLLGTLIDNDGTGTLNFDRGYCTYYSCFLSECSEDELNAILNDENNSISSYLTDEVKKLLIENFDREELIEEEEEENEIGK